MTDSASNAPQIATTSSAWTETGLTWNNQPAPGTVPVTSAARPNTFIEYPVTVAVNGDGTYSFVLVGQSSNGRGWPHGAIPEPSTARRDVPPEHLRRHRGAERADRCQRGGRLVVARRRVLDGLDRQRRSDRLRRPARRRRHRVGVGTTLTYPDATVAHRYLQLPGGGQGCRQLGPSVASSVTTPPSGPTTVSFVAEADSYTDGTAAAANFGTATNVFADTSPAQRGYLRFVASGITGTVQSAVVRVWVTDSASNAPQIATTSSAWTETGLTWNNQPAPGTVTGDLGSASKNTFIEYPVTVAVNGDGTYSFVLVGQSSNGLGGLTGGHVPEPSTARRDVRLRPSPAP